MILENLAKTVAYGCAIAGAHLGWTESETDPIERNLTSPSGNLRGSSLDILRNAPLAVMFSGCRFKLQAEIWANIPFSANSGEPKIGLGLTVSETGDRTFPSGATLDYVWLVREKKGGSEEALFRDLRGTPFQSDVRTPSLVGKFVEDLSLSWFPESDRVKVVAGIRTPGGQLLMLGTSARANSAS